jgi:hypothetical protein
MASHLLFDYFIVKLVTRATAYGFRFYHSLDHQLPNITETSSYSV